jgi:RimJ/RimL family protein N-acetyltransferase
MASASVRLDEWSAGDLDLLRRVNAPDMTSFLGGPESDEQVVARHGRYLALSGAGTGRMFRVTVLPEQIPAGTIGYWEKDWRGETVYETGWSTLPELQGRGIAVAAARAVALRAAAERRHRWLHAYPKVEHAASNAVCRKAGFELLGEADFEYPAGHPIRCNDWRLDLSTVIPR